MSADRKTFRLQVMSINGVFYDDRASEIILPCIDGQYAILADHEELVLAIYNGKMIIRDSIGDKIEAVVGVGSAQIANNRVIVLVDTAEKPEDIDRRRAQRALERAEEEMRQNNSIKEYYQAQAAMARALSRLKHSADYGID
ncbi:ATP synthase F1 subunit epsilon [Butyrivibrio sp. VCD2006]|uniref:ATP synthase F1 subunit epsilon n=1 Tax=Butyrivibrio sp. VCD2006 TaxID=1280664 RepID=UPI0004790EA8|nr:ATP synthase F1 subunit epsilon [Butyrivibrio sp. VCD2006]